MTLLLLLSISAIKLFGSILLFIATNLGTLHQMIVLVFKYLHDETIIFIYEISNFDLRDIVAISKMLKETHVV